MKLGILKTYAASLLIAGGMLTSATAFAQNTQFGVNYAGVVPPGPMTTTPGTWINDRLAPAPVVLTSGPSQGLTALFGRGPTGNVFMTTKVPGSTFGAAVPVSQSWPGTTQSPLAATVVGGSNMIVGGIAGNGAPLGNNFWINLSNGTNFGSWTNLGHPPSGKLSTVYTPIILAEPRQEPGMSYPNFTWVVAVTSDGYIWTNYTVDALNSSFVGWQPLYSDGVHQVIPMDSQLDGARGQARITAAIQTSVDGFQGPNLHIFARKPSGNAANDTLWLSNYGASFTWYTHFLDGNLDSGRAAVSQDGAHHLAVTGTITFVENGLTKQNLYVNIFDGQSWSSWQQLGASSRYAFTPAISAFPSADAFTVLAYAQPLTNLFEARSFMFKNGQIISGWPVGSPVKWAVPQTAAMSDISAAPMTSLNVPMFFWKQPAP